jgi:small-conductance mechanosensitive channel
MNFFDDINNVSEALIKLWADASEHLLDLSVAVQLSAIISIFILVKLFIQPRLKSYLSKLAKNTLLPYSIKKPIYAIRSISGDLAWLILQWVAMAIAESFDQPVSILKVVTSLLTAWVIIRMATLLVQNRTLSLGISIFAWSIAALNIFGLLDATITLLDSWSIMLGEIRLSPLFALKIVIFTWLFFWAANSMSDVIEKVLSRSTTLTPSIRVLTVKLSTFTLYGIAFLVATSAAGIDLTALAVFTGALGVGLGFGLQKIFSNLVSGVLLLMDKAIKPGDVISVGQGSFGWVNYLGARYVSVITRDGIEHLIPNEELIVQRVENWSYSDDKVRLKIPIGISYNSDVRKAMQLCLDSAGMVARVLKDPEPRIQLRNFGNSSVDLELRIWVDDPENGRANVISDVLLNVWDKFHEHDISIPFPQQDLHINTVLGQQNIADVVSQLNAANKTET